MIESFINFNNNEVLDLIHKEIGKLKDSLRVIISEKYQSKYQYGDIRVLCEFIQRRKSWNWISDKTSELVELIQWLFRNARFNNKTNTSVFMLVKYCTLSLCVNGNGSQIDAKLFRILEKTFQSFPCVFLDFIPLLNNLEDDCIFEMSTSQQRSRSLKTFFIRLTMFVNDIDNFRKNEIENSQVIVVDEIDLSVLAEDVIFYVVFSFFDEVDLIRLSGNLNSEYRRKLLESLSGKKSKSERFFFFLFHPPHLIDDSFLSVLIDKDIVDASKMMGYTYPLIFAKNYPKSLSCVIKKKITNFTIRHELGEDFEFKTLLKNPPMLHDFCKLFKLLLSQYRNSKKCYEIIDQYLNFLDYLRLMSSDFRINGIVMEKLLSVTKSGGHYGPFKPEWNDILCKIFYSWYYNNNNENTCEKEGYLWYFLQNIHLSVYSLHENIIYILNHTREEYRQKGFIKNFVESILTSETEFKKIYLFPFFLKGFSDPSFANWKFLLRLAKLDKKWNWLILYLLTFDDPDGLGYKDILRSEEIKVIVNEFMEAVAGYTRHRHLPFFRVNIGPKLHLLLEKCEMGENEINNLFGILLQRNFHESNIQIVKEMIRYPYSRNLLKKEYLTIHGVIEKILEFKSLESENIEKSLRQRAIKVCVELEKCTSWATGKRLILQKNFSCRDCPQLHLEEGQNCICEVCAKECHNHSNIDGFDGGNFEMVLCYCDCFFGDWGIECKCKNEKL